MSVFLDLRINLRNQRKRQTKCQSLLQPRDRKHTNKFDRSEELRWRSSLVHEPTCNISIAWDLQLQHLTKRYLLLLENKTVGCWSYLLIYSEGKKKKGEGGGSTVSQWKFSNWLSSNLVLHGGATHLSSRARYPPSKQQLWTISQLANAKHAMTPKESNLKLFHAESLRERTLDCFS